MLKSTGQCKFDLKKSGVCLQPIAFGSQYYTIMESKLHSFVGEATASRWAIFQNHKYLWGAHFFRLCDCATIKEMFEYERNSILIMRWAQKLLGYDFTVVLQSNRMMVYFNALTHHFGKPIGQNLHITNILYQWGVNLHTKAYYKLPFSTYQKT